MVASPVVSPPDSSGTGGQLSPGPSPSPRRTRRPRWLDLRLVVGVVLVIGSVLLGAFVVTRAQASAPVWSLRRDLPAGAVLGADDVVAVDVRLGAAAGGYVGADRAVVGSRLAADVRAGQLLPAAAIGGAGGVDLVTVSIPFATSDAPTVVRGDRITVWLSTPTCSSLVLLPSVGVQEVGDPDSGLTAIDGVKVVVSVSPELADRVVTALALDDVVLRAGVLSGPGAAGGAGTGDLPDLAPCGATAAGATPSPAGS